MSGSGDLPYRSHEQSVSPSLRGDARVWFDQAGWLQTVHPLRIRLRIALTPTGGPLYTWGAWDPDDGTSGPPLETYGIGFPLPTPGHEFDLKLDEEFRIKAGQSGPTGTPALITWGETAPGEFLAPWGDDPR